MKFSVITPSLNQGQFIEETILSVLNQEYENIEYIIIDGGSIDTTLSIIEKYQNRIAYWVSEPDRGQSHAINKGLTVCTGDIVTWINSDDQIADGAIPKVAALFQERPDAGVVYGEALMMESSGQTYKSDIPARCPIEHYLCGMAFVQPSSYFRKETLGVVGYLDESYHYTMDYDLFSRLALVTDFVGVNSILSKFRLHPSSKSVTVGNKFVEDEIKIFINLLINLKADYVLGELKKLRVFDSFLCGPFQLFPFQFNRKEIDTLQLMLRFLRRLFNADYSNGNFSRAQVVGRYMIKSHRDYLKADPGLSKVVWRSVLFPSSLIHMARSLSAD